MAIKNHASPTPNTILTPEQQKRSTTLPLALLVFGDLVVFIVFSITGMLSHKEPLTANGIATVAAPFAIGWFLVAPFIGAFRRTTITNPAAMALRTILSWIAGCAIGMLIRGLFVEHAVPKTSFMIVALISNTIFLLIWRLPFAWISRLKNR